MRVRIKEIKSRPSLYLNWENSKLVEMEIVVINGYQVGGIMIDLGKFYADVHLKIGFGNHGENSDWEGAVLVKKSTINPNVIHYRKGNIEDYRAFINDIKRRIELGNFRIIG